MLRFTVREGLLVMLVCAMAGAWWTDHQLMARSHARIEQECEKHRLTASILLTLRHPSQGDMCNAPYVCGTVGSH
jgi:hypothetical protein